jgi:hypothetical protein
MCENVESHVALKVLPLLFERSENLNINMRILIVVFPCILNNHTVNSPTKCTNLL